MLGIGIRVGLERGLHRSRRGEQKPTFDDELYKRTFWFVAYICYITCDFQVFQGLDRNGSSDKQHLWSTTRTTRRRVSPYSVLSCQTLKFCIVWSFDIELPVDCDDEYWEIDESSHVTFNQPPGKPSRVTAFIAHLRLTEILVYSMRTLHSTRKSKTSQISDEEWEQRIVTEVDSAMNQWKDGLPNHRTYVCVNIFCGNLNDLQSNGTRNARIY